MIPHTWRLAGLLGPLVLLAACGYGGQQRATRLLDSRLQDRLALDIAANRAALQPLPDGAQVTLLGPSTFENDTKALDNQKTDIRASVIEGLLDPYLVQVYVADTSSLPDEQRAARVRNVVRYFADNGLASVLRQDDAPPAAPPGTPPAGLTITISVHCPPPHAGWGYGSGKADPTCF